MKLKTNILYIFHVSIIGGGSFCLLNMIKKLDRKHYNPIILLKNRGPLCTELEKIGATVFIEKTISTVPYNRSIFEIGSINQIISVILSLKKIKYWIRKVDADIVHINTMMMYPYALPAHKLGKKVIIHMREHWPSNQHQIQFKIAQRMIDKYSNKIIAINKTSAEVIGLPQKTQIIYDWIDFDKRDEFINFKKLFGNDFKSLKIFLFVGGLQKIKGALEVIQIFYEQIHEKNARLLFVGCNEKCYDNRGYKAKIKALLRIMGLPVYSDKIKSIAQKDDRIVLIPSTYQIKSLIEQAFCLVSFPTIPHANLPIAEAIWLGKPIISADTPEAQEYSNNGESAILFKMNNKDEFKKALTYALENDTQIEESAKNGSKNIQLMFDSKRNSNLLNDAYKRLFY